MTETAGSWISPWVLCMLAAVFVSIVLLVYSSIRLVSKGLQSYEEKYVAGARQTLDAMYLTMTPQQILYLSLLSSLVVFILLTVTSMNLVIGIVCGALAFMLPSVIIRILKWRRDKKFGVQLVDGLMAMGNALRAGHALPAALELLAREMDNPMGQEMRLVVQEIRLGVPMEEALSHLHERMPLDDLDILIMSITISREVGGNLAEVFDNIADTIRERHRIEGKIAALTAQGKLQGIIVAMLPIMIGIFLNAWNPKLMAPMYSSWIGLGLLGLIVFLEALGGYMIYRIVSINI